MSSKAAIQDLSRIILTIRGTKVILDADLATLYAVPTKAFNQAVKMSVALIEAFVRLRQELATTQTLARRLAVIERTVIHHDSALKEVFQVIRPMLAPPPETPRKKIGFRPDTD